MKKGTQWKTNGASKILGLSVLLDPATHDNINSNNHTTVQRITKEIFIVADDSRGQFNADSNFFTGWKVLIHDPAEFPEVNKKGIFVGSGQEVSIGVSGQTSESTPAVRAMSPKRRKCLLRSETDTSLYNMTLFHEYKKSSCHFENTVFGLLK